MKYRKQVNKMSNAITYNKAVQLDKETIIKQTRIIKHLSILKDNYYTDDIN